MNCHPFMIIVLATNPLREIHNAEGCQLFRLIIETFALYSMLEGIDDPDLTMLDGIVLTITK